MTGWVRRLPGFAAQTAAAAFGIAAYCWVTAPDVRPLRTANLPTTAFMAMRAEEAARAHARLRKDQHWVGYDQISADLKRAVLVAEDDAFFEHHGLDWAQIRLSLMDTLKKGEPLRGASTITQQLAKNLYLSPSRNPFRKLTELVITRRLEAVLGKRRIFELYLNDAEWGDGIWGCDAAARTYFDESAGALDADQSALLAAALINPRIYNPAHPNSRLRWRQHYIRGLMGSVEK